MKFKHLFVATIVFLGFLFTVYLYSHYSPQGYYVTAETKQKEVMPIFYKCYSPQMEEAIDLLVTNVTIPRYTFGDVCHKACALLNSQYVFNFTGRLEQPEDVLSQFPNSTRVCVCAAPVDVSSILCRDDLGKKVNWAPMLALVQQYDR